MFYEVIGNRRCCERYTKLVPKFLGRISVSGSGTNFILRGLGVVCALIVIDLKKNEEAVLWDKGLVLDERT